MNFIKKLKLDQKYNTIIREWDEIKYKKYKNLAFLFKIKKFFLESFYRRFIRIYDKGNRKVSLIKILISFPWTLLRFTIIKLVLIIDHYFEIPFGFNSDLPIRRTLYFENKKIIVNPRTSGLDYRCSIWKKEALKIILDEIENEKEELDFIEIGAASGFVSIFLSLKVKDLKLKNRITCVEPNLDNIQFLESTALFNNLDIKIVPLALGLKNEWVDFSNDQTRGLVGSQPNRKFSRSALQKKIMVDKFFLKTYCEKISFCYIDTLMNEVRVLMSIAEVYKDIKYYLIEIDEKESFKFINEFLLNLDYSLKRSVGLNYLFVKNNN